MILTWNPQEYSGIPQVLTCSKLLEPLYLKHSFAAYKKALAYIFFPCYIVGVVLLIYGVEWCYANLILFSL